MAKTNPPTEAHLPVLLQDMVLDSADVHTFLDGLAELVVAHLSREDKDFHCGISLLRPRAKTTVASSSARAKLLDELQYDINDGPCLRAVREGQPYCVQDFHEETRFGGYPQAISEHGIRSALGVPIALDGVAAAGLNLYSPMPDAFTQEDIAAAEDVAREASRALRMAVRLAHLADTTEQLRSAMTSRTTIDVAAGIIMAQNRCSHETAMSILKAASSGRNLKVAEIATAVVTSIGQQVPRTHFED